MKRSMFVFIFSMIYISDVSFAGTVKFSKSFETNAIIIGHSDIECLQDEGQIVVNRTGQVPRPEYTERDVLNIDRETIRRTLRSIRKDSKILDDITRVIFVDRIDKPIKPLAFPLEREECLAYKKFLIDRPGFKPVLTQNEKTNIYFSEGSNQICRVRIGNYLSVSFFSFFPGEDGKLVQKLEKFSTGEESKEFRIKRLCEDLFDVNRSPEMAPVRDFIKKKTVFNKW